jgi:hypothetical protein
MNDNPYAPPAGDAPPVPPRRSGRARIVWYMICGAGCIVLGAFDLVRAESVRHAVRGTALALIGGSLFLTVEGWTAAKKERRLNQKLASLFFTLGCCALVIAEFGLRTR